MNNENLVDISQADKNHIVLPKDVVVLNTLGMGIAIQFLAKITGEEIEAWKEYVQTKASEQYNQLSSQQIQEIANTLEHL